MRTEQNPKRPRAKWWDSWLLTVLALLGASVIVYLLLVAWYAAQ
jgi:hypothetical protein